MTAGDLIHWEAGNFTPAAGVEVMCMWVETGAGSVVYWGFESAATVSYNYYTMGASATATAVSNDTVSGIKLCLTNTYYYHNFTAGYGGCGVQTK